jgi:hypothetical protein
VVEGNESATGLDTPSKPVVETIDADAIPPDEPVVVEGNESATGPDTPSKPVVETMTPTLSRRMDRSWSRATKRLPCQTLRVNR